MLALCRAAHHVSHAEEAMAIREPSALAWAHQPGPKRTLASTHRAQEIKKPAVRGGQDQAEAPPDSYSIGWPESTKFARTCRFSTSVELTS